MKIQLSQDEIAQAVRDYVSKGVTLSGNTQMAVDFSMGRGDNGLSATIDVPYMGVTSLPVTTPTTVVTGAVAPQQQTLTQVDARVTQAEDPAAAVTSGVSAVNEAAQADAGVEAGAAAPAGKSLFGTGAAS